MFKKCFTFAAMCLVLSLFCTIADVFAASCGPQPSGLVSWWKAEGNGKDSVGGNNGTLVSGATFSTGIVGQAFSLDSLSQYISIPDASSLRPTNLTLEAWVKFTVITGEVFIIGKPIGNENVNSFALWYSNASGNLIGVTAYDSLSVPFNPVLNTWYHLAYSYSSQLKAHTLYINGQVAASGQNNTSIAYDDHPVLIGADNDYGIMYGYFPGLIDEVRIFNRTLSDSEIQGIYDSGTTGMCATADVPKTGQTAKYSTGDDGDLQIGISWPEPRFIVASSGTGTMVTDELTGLIWPQNGGTPTVDLCTGGTLTWQAALNYVACLNTNTYLGYNDWRLPNVNELKSIVIAGQANIPLWLNTHGFAGALAANYWSSTSYAADTTTAWFVDFSYGSAISYTKNYGERVWPVRSGPCGASGSSSICLPRTGQTTSYAAGDDGSLQQGIALPSPRFTNADNSVPVNSSVVVDQLTGLMWTRNVSPSDGTWQGALTYIAGLNTANYLGYHDWRLPNVYELQSIVNYGKPNEITWLTSQGLTNAQPWNYWSSTSITAFAGYVLFSYMGDGVVNLGETNRDNYLWPVRGGQSGSLALLTVVKSGAGIGTVTTNRGSIIWNGAIGTATIGSQVAVTLTATPDGGSTFSGWSGDPDCADGTVVMSADINCVATFLPPPASGATLSPDVSSPQIIGNSVTFTAGGVGGSGNYEYRFWLKTGGVWNPQGAYSATNTWTWDTTGAGAGSYAVQVYVRNAGSSAKNEAVKTLSYVLASPPTAGATLSPDLASPLLIGNNNITFTAGGVGGSGNYEYRFWLKTGGVWSPTGAYSTTDTWTWNTLGVPAGTYGVQVYVRNAGSSAKSEAVKNLSYVLVPSTPATGATLSPDHASPQTAGTDVTFTAGGVGGSGSYEYKFWVKAAGVWTPMQGYSATETWTWDTTGLTPGSYRVQVYVRNVGSSAQYEAVIGMAYVIQ